MNEPTWYVGIHLRMRGAYSIFFVVHILPLSPTHMGQITDFLRDTLPVLAHPRAYGAGTVRSTSGSRRLGSSPCIRGRRQMVYYCTCSCGLISVYTGQAFVRFKTYQHCTAHPRAYGASPKSFKKVLWIDG